MSIRHHRCLSTVNHSPANARSTSVASCNSRYVRSVRLPSVLTSTVLRKPEEIETPGGVLKFATPVKAKNKLRMHTLQRDLQRHVSKQVNLKMSRYFLDKFDILLEPWMINTLSEVEIQKVVA